ncbi:MAG: hypothetical protein LBS64_02645 [Spirochaetaceae bacterium]|jgi:hypothetical protein|nr:hypothetical protein [Spirochaetaceae bacterium]
MTDAEFEVYRNRVITQQEHDEIMADIRRIGEEIHQVALEDPLPDDFIDYCKGRKFFRQAVAQ